ncbi:MAG: SH3 domain-containing protein [Desulfomonilaceae bacterium]
MTIQVIFSIIQIVAMVSSLVIWRMWIKKKLASSFLIEDEDRFLFPFRYISWVLGGVVLVTILAQVHFLWVSGKLSKEDSKIQAVYTKVENQGHNVDEMKRIIEKLSRDVELNFKALKVFGKDQLNQMRSNKLTNDLRLRQNDPTQKDISSTKSTPIKSASLQNPFGQEAKASSASSITDSTKRVDHSIKDSSSMRLNRRGKATTDNLRVRKQPSEESQIVDRLMAGQPVKITEKKVSGDKIWFRVITPSGKAGWVDYSYVRLDGAA